MTMIWTIDGSEYEASGFVRLFCAWWYDSGMQRLAEVRVFQLDGGTC